MKKYFWIVFGVFLQTTNVSWSIGIFDYWTPSPKFMSSQPSFDVINVPLSHYTERYDAPIKAVVLHCVGLPTVFDIVNTFQTHGVSSNYLVPQISGEEVLKSLPDIYQILNQHRSCCDQIDLTLPRLQFPNKVPVIQFVADNKEAYHAGQSYFSNWNQHYTDIDVRLGMTPRSLNTCTLGVEFQAPGYGDPSDTGDVTNGFAFTPYTDAQMETGIAFLNCLKNTYELPNAHFLAHSTIAPMRKTDPGPLFPWRKLAEHGIGYMPPLPSIDAAALPLTPDNIQTFQKHLERIGFRTDVKSSFGAFRWGEFDEETKKCLSAYTLQYFPEQWQKPDDITLTQSLLQSLESFDEKEILTTYSGKHKD